MSFVQPFVVTQPPRLESWSPAMKLPRGPVEVPQGDTDGHQPRATDVVFEPINV